MTFIYDEKTMNKIRILEKYIHGILALPEVRELLNCSERTVYRIKKRFQHLGPPGLLHGLKNRPSNHQGENTKYHFIISILRRYPKYHDFGPTLLKEHLEEDFGVLINKETLRQIMMKEGIWKAKIQKKKIAHQKRERKGKYGMMVQFDGSYHDWFEKGERACLLCAVDDATSKVCAQFSKGESFEEVFAFWKKYFSLFGKPEAIYVDRHASYKVNSPDDQRDAERLTRFARGMLKLGVVMIYSKIPQGKGRVEKGNQTHQDRLVKKMRLLGIKNREAGNKYLEEKYLREHNARFAVEAKEVGDSHQILTVQEEQELERYFAKEEVRYVSNDGTVKYKKRTYQLEKGIILKSRSIIVKENSIGEIMFFDGENVILPIKKR